MLVVVVALVGSTTASKRRRVYHGFFFASLFLFVLLPSNYVCVLVCVGGCWIGSSRGVH